MKHGGPDYQGIRAVVQTDTESIVRLGHNRLSIIDLSEKSNQPMFYDGAYLLFNGEIYNYKELIEKYDLQMETDGDSEVILKLYRRLGQEFFKQLDGEYAIVIYDERNNDILAVRDPIGIKPLYLHYRVGKGLVLSSEAKGILPYLDQVSSDSNEMTNLLNYGYPMYGSLFRGIETLSPGVLVSFGTTIMNPGLKDLFGIKSDKTADEIFKRRSYVPRHKEETDPTVRVREAVENAVKKRMISDVPISVTLSGGLDSSIVAGLVAKYSTQPIKTYTIGFSGLDNEFEQAKRVADYLGSDHTEILVSPLDVIRDIESILYHLEDPMDRGSSMLTYYLAQSIKEKVTLIGEGADECFGGYKRHIQNPPKEANEYVSEYLEVFPSYESELNHLNLYDSEDPNSLLTIDLLNEIPNFHTMRIDKLFMAQGIEARVPYLDPEVIEAAMNTSFRHKIDPPKKVLRESFKDEFPDWMLNQPKKALKLPYDSFVVMDEVRRIIERNPIISLEEVDYLYSLSGDPPRNWGRKLWQLYLITKWYDVFVR